MADKTSNFEKHASKNPLQKLLIGNFYETLILLSKNLKAKTILDAGCGEGFTLQKFYEAKIGEYLEGIEYSESAIEISKKIHPLLKIKKGDIYKLPYKENFFDLIICSEVLEHLDDPKKALNELKRVSKKYLLLSVPNEPLFTIQRFLRG
ncbi:MAG: class I SAM-dependent methyltransferase, partial [bacterium]|nr:class I SAM-dependent methyltransferase [bacterium]